MGSEWENVKLGDVLGDKGYIRGPFGSALKRGELLTKGIPVYEQQHAIYGTREFRFFIDEEKYQTLSRFTVKPNDLIISCSGTLGRISVINNNDPVGIISQALLILRPDVLCIDPTFFYYILSSPAGFQSLVSVSTGSVQVNIAKRSIIESIEIPLPPLPEQKAIAHILGSLDDKIELNRQMNATLESMAQALFKSWFVDFDPVIDNALVAGNPIPEELTERAEVRRKALTDGTANREIAKQFPATFQLTEELGWIPEGWEVKPIVEQVSLTMGQSPSSEYYNKIGKGLPFHQGVTNYGERFPKHEQYSTGGNRHAEQGDILFSVRAPVGRINISDCRIIIGRGLSALRHKKNYQGFLVYFLKHVFQKEDSIGSGTIFNAVNKKDMESIPYLIPTDDLAIIFNTIANSLDKKIANNAIQTQSLSNIRDTLLPKLISGELRIPDAEKLAKEVLT